MSDNSHISIQVKVVIGIMVVLLTIALCWNVLQLSFASGPVEDIAANLSQSGTTNNVTAVLLNFRGYDTLLEVTVLLLVVIGTWSVTQDKSPENIRTKSILVKHLIKFLFPLLAIVSGYLVWAGSFKPGGAFQAGTMLAAIGILFYLSGEMKAKYFSYQLLRLGLAFGVAIFYLIVIGVMYFNKHFFEFPGAWASLLILIIEVCLTISIAVILTSLFIRRPLISRKIPK